MPPQECHECIQDAAPMILQRCPNQKEAIIWYEECTLRYANRSIFSSEEERPWGYYNSTGKVPISVNQFEQILLTTMNSLIKQAAYSNAKGFAAGEANLTAFQKVYCLVQCSPDILGSPCETCLKATIRDMPICCGVGYTWTMIYQPSCQLRYDLARFFDVETLSNSQPTAISSPFPSGKHRLSLVIIVVVAVGLLLISICGVSFFLYQRKVKEGKGFAASGLRPFTYEELNQATDGFSSANLLGQGGFGYDYKGVLPDQKIVAIKQLKEGSPQGEHEFLSEIEIISRVHHRNIVHLIGYCISRSKRLLVYEYVPNNSLDTHIHGSEASLHWSTRMRVAVGAAKGLAYLHEDCDPRIIHRDIKSTNILLDSKFNAKVADFGLAKFFTDNNTHITTDVEGTPGYLAPEYHLSGKLTEKSDIFSFGVVLLELITGRKPAYLLDWARPLLVRALKDSDFDALIDPRLEQDYDYDGMTRMIVCATICVHPVAECRFKMSQGNMSVDYVVGENASMSVNASSVSSINPLRMNLEELRMWAFAMQEQSTTSGSWTWPSTESTQHHSGLSSHGNTSHATTSKDLYPPQIFNGAVTEKLEV